MLSVTGYVLAVAATAPALDELKPIDKGATSVIFAADGSRLGYVRSDEIRDPISWRDMPESMRDAVVAIEDERFYKHKGVDYGAIVRAGVRNIESGKNVQGGSTITQQLVRALYIKDPGRNYERKIREAKLASELEKEHSKRWILHNYLNSVPFGTVGGRTAVGTEAAAQIFFSKSAQEPAAARGGPAGRPPPGALAVQPVPQPERRAPAPQRGAAGHGQEPLHHARRRPAEASEKDLGVRRGRRYTARREPYFFDYVEEKLIEEYGVGVYRRGGLKVHTTIDPKLQQAARKSDHRPAALQRGPLVGDRVHRSQDGLHQGDGIERHLQRPHVQPRGPGPPPAGVGVQDHGAHHRHPQGRTTPRAPGTARSRSTSTCPATGRGR